MAGASPPLPVALIPFFNRAPCKALQRRTKYPPASPSAMRRLKPTGGALQGKGNLSPYSYFNVMSHDPPYVTIGCSHTRQRPNHMKDSEQNLLETGCAA